MVDKHYLIAHNDLLKIDGKSENFGVYVMDCIDNLQKNIANIHKAYLLNICSYNSGRI